MACERNDEVVAKKILECPKFNRKLFHVLSIPQPLFAAVASNHAHLADIMIQAGCDINMVRTLTCTWSRVSQWVARLTRYRLETHPFARNFTLIS